MQKSKALPIFLLDATPSPSKLNDLFSLDVERVVVFGLYGMEESFKMEKALDKSHRDKIFFVHMADSAFKRAGAKSFSEKTDFAFYHFFYDIFKVAKFNFKQLGFTHWSWVKDLDLDKMNRIISKITIENKSDIIFENKNTPNLGGSIKISKFDKIMNKNIFSDKDEVETNGN